MSVIDMPGGSQMSTYRLQIVSVLVLTCLLIGAAPAETGGTRSVLARADIDGAPGMEFISAVSEYRPGDSIGRHFHHGVETGYVLQGGVIKPRGKAPVVIPTGAVLKFARGEHHAGFTVVGDTPLRIFTTHIVDKGKPLFAWVE